MTRSLPDRAMSGLRWMSVNVVGERILSFGTTMVLARLLDPAHFGLYALAFVVIDSLGIFKNLGLDAAIIQRKDRVEDAADTALFVLPLIGLSLCLLLAAAAPVVSRWMGHPELTRVIQALGLALILMSLGNVPAALVQRQLKFRIRTVANLTGMLLYAVLAITLARRGWGVWSLVVGYLSRWAISVPIQWLMLGWTPRWRFDRALLREMLHFSQYIVGAWIVGFLAMNVDKVAIGRWLGATQLGYYTLCLGLANIVTTQLSERVYHVAFPAFAEAQHDADLLRRGFLKLLKYLFLCALPISFFLMLVPRDLLRVFYGPRWVEAAPLLRILALAGALQVVRGGIEPMLLGCGRSRAVFKLNLVQLAILGTGSFWMAHAGRLTGVAWTVVLAAGVPGMISLQVMMRHVGVTGWELIRHMRAVWMSAVGMAAAVLAVNLARPWVGGAAMSSVLWLAVLVPVGGLAYLLAVLWSDRPLIQELLRVWRPSAALPSKRPR